MWLIKPRIALTLMVCLQGLSVSLAAEDNIVVAETPSVSISLEEWQHVLEGAPVRMVEDAAEDDLARYALMANLVVSLTMEQELESLANDEDREAYLAYRFAMLAAAREFHEQYFQNQLEIPDLDALAKEQYRIAREDIAGVPEVRNAAHILIRCGTDCDRDDARLRIDSVNDQLLADGDFYDLAKEFSEDPGSKEDGGVLTTLIREDDRRLAEGFRKAVFALESEGDVSDVVETQLGYHLIKLEKITPAYIRPFNDVKAPLVREVERRYRQQSYADYVKSLQPGDDLVYDAATVQNSIEEAIRMKRGTK